MLNTLYKSMSKSVLIQSGFVFSAFLAQAGESGLVLTDAVETGKRNSPELKRLGLIVEASGAKRWEAISGFLPQLSVNANYFFNAKYASLGINFGSNPVTIPSAYPQTNIEITGSWTFFDGFATWNSYQASVLGYEAAQLEFEDAQFRSLNFIRTRFFQALAAQQLAEVANQNIETLEHHLSLVQMNEQAGTGTRVDVLRLQAQLEEARAEKILADDNTILARWTLAEAMGVDEAPQRLEGTLPVPAENQVPDSLQFKVAERRDLQAQVKRELASDRMSSAGWGSLIPRASLFAVEQFFGYNNFFNSSISATDGLQNAWGFGLRLSWNLFDGGASIAKKVQFDAQAKQAAQVTRKTLLSAAADFETWRRRYTYNVVLFKARQRTVEQYEESVRLATISVKAGTKTHWEFLDAERDLFRARAGVIQAQLAAAESLSHLENASGHSFN